KSGPVPILEGVGRVGPNGRAHYAFSPNGTLIYIPGTGTVTSALQRTLALVDRKGKVRPLLLPPQNYSHPRISPDGKQLAVASSDPQQAMIWIYDLKGSSPARRLTLEGRSSDPIWTPDGQYVTFSSDRNGERGLFRQRADGSAPAERLTKAEQGANHVPESWSADNKTLAVSVTGPNTASVWVVSMEGERKASPFVPPSAAIQRNADFSRDGRWLAYNSNEGAEAPGGVSLGDHVFVQPFPATGAKYQLSTDR